ncbi:hypothetical protein MGALJ_61980 (plasmid) [Mycobacterium gallinarum]|uniref:Uncharacterized protein n=1 Tax=Mycobacterium gallinarum TaxID=39689 RepID=A0A9W4B9T2_9MYCO|nr:hypothetical protein [Mycobacterium gallinarum]BBY96358.1 hypothetical protein MGALJ_60270 [Mycobacterium gallinarum]BBY96529.1 hypothetical protein MGALJ_61980 [Mycobacterium gallinarum]
MAGFKMDPNFEKNVTKQVAKNMQSDIDAVFRQHKGQSVDAVKRALQRKLGTALVEPALTTVAESISRGEKVTLKL